MLGALILAALLAPDTDNNVTYQALPLLLCSAGGGGLLEPVVQGAVLRDPPVADGSGPRAARSTTASLVQNLSAKAHSGLTLLENLADPRPSFEEFVAAAAGRAESAPLVPIQRQPAHESLPSWRL